MLSSDFSALCTTQNVSALFSTINRVGHWWNKPQIVHANQVLQLATACSLLPVMIYTGTYLEVSDNSGAKEVQCINTGKRSFARIGDLITVAVKKVGQDRKVEKGTVQKAIIVETHKEFQRLDGSVLRFDRNACVLVNQKLQPIGTRIFGFVTHELRKRQMLKILSLTSRVL